MVNKDRAANIAALNDAFRQQPPRHPPPPCYPYRMPSNTVVSSRRMTTIAGTLFLIWFFFSPLLAAGTYFKWVSPEGFLPAFIPYLISVYALTGIAVY